MGEKLYDLTAPQQSILLTEQYFKGANINHICGSAFIHETIDFGILKKAVNLLVQYNDSLRIRLYNENNEIKQYVGQYTPFEVNIVDVNSQEDVANIEKNLMEHVFDIYSNMFICELFRFPNGTGGFSVNVHHLVSDSWTLGLVARGIVHIYSCLSKNEEIDISAIASYTAYIESEENYVSSNKFIKDKEYWNSVFEDIPEAVSIPSKAVNTDNFSCKANRILYNIPQKDMDKINVFCKQTNISVFNFFMAIFSIYISRVSNSEDVVIGTPILNRTNFKEKNTMGMFINVVPCRMNLQNNLSFQDFVSNIAKQSLSMLRHQKYSYQHILEDLRQKNPNLPNLYNIVMSYQVTRANIEQGLSYDTRWAFNGNCGDDLDIHLFDLNDTGSVNIAYDYRVNKYDDDEIRSIHERILHMIHQVLCNEMIGIHDIEIVTSKEKYEILYGFNHLISDSLTNHTIIELFEEQVQNSPNKVALVFYDKQLTYGDLNEKANQLANYLLTYSLKKEDVVGIFLDKSLEMIIAILAILKVGACYLPIDIDYPKSRIDYMLDNSNTKLILSSHSVSHLLDTKVNILAIDLDEDIYQTSSKSFSPINTYLPCDLAYIMYTSGSTGNPKGVMIEQKSIVRLVKDTNFISFNDNDRILQTGSIVFDACTFEIWAALLNGLELYIIKKSDLLTISVFEKFLKNNKISILWLTAPLFNQICEQNPSIFKDVRCLLTGGDVLSPKHIKMVKVSNPSLSVINGYGPTENTTFSCCFTVDTIYEQSIPIGNPITNSSCYVVSKYGNLQPIGIPGELWVGGHGVARGYLNNKTLTDKVFLNNVFDNSRIYKTGDLVKWLPNGNIEFIGRIDNQVKIRGFRVELNEINSKILQNPNIKESITLIHTNNNDKFICAYVVFNTNYDVTELKNYLKQSLPTYMVPSFIIPLDVLPINTNGKVDKKKLPEINLHTENDNFIEPSTPTEIELANIWKKLLNISKISSNNHFFEIGGDSLLAIKLASYLLSSFKIEITVSNIFEHPVLSELANFIDSNHVCKDTTTIQKYNSLSYYPVSSAQKRIYYASSLDVNSTLYNIAGGIILNNILDAEKLQNCFNILIDRHEALRTHFEIKDNDIVQVVDDKIDFSLTLETTTSDNINDIYTNFVKPLDLSKAPLFRVKLTQLNNKQTLLLLDMHHIISDGTSLHILLQELCNLYNDVSLTQKQIDYTDFTLWEKEQFETIEFKKVKEYWVNQFKDEIPLLNMPTSYPRPSTQSFEGANYRLQLSEEIVNNINQTSRQLNITPYMLMLSCYYILLSKYSSQDDIVVGTPIIGRNLPELNDVLGMFVNTLALRNKIDSHLSFEAFSQMIKENCINSFKYQNYPFDHLVKELNIKRDVGRNSLFDVMFVYQNDGYPNINFKDVETNYFIPDNDVSKFDLTLEVIPIDNKYALRFEYCTKLFNEDFIQRLSSHYINIINAVLENANITIDKIDMLSKEEKHQILYDFNNTKMDYPHDKTIAQLFEEQVEKTPDNIAVVFENKKLTYRELNEKANQLARFLKDNSISTSDIVGISMERSFEIILCMLAVLKAGAAYLPIDPTYPKSRISYIIKDSHIKMLLTKHSLSQIFLDVPFVFEIDIEGNPIYTNYSKDNLYLPSTSDDLAYLIYTSGSTGNPKGVMISNRNVNNFVYGVNHMIQFSKYKSIASVTTMCFDIFVLETILPLEIGLTIILASNEEQNIPALLNTICLNNNVDMLQTTPSKIGLLISDNSNLEYIKRLKCIMLGGEPLNENILLQLQKITNAKIFNMYGPTETTVWSTIKDMTNKKKITIGTPIANTQIYILNKDLNLVPIGMSGDLYIGGVGVSKGYLNRDKLTNDKFVNNPFIENDIIYNTGDLASWNFDGEINCLGRSDFQVKIRGLRIELGEIEKQILQYQNISNAVVCAKTDSLNRQFLCGYFVASSRISTPDLKNYLGKFLPNYMIPSYFMQLDDFKYTPNGKIDRKSLPTPKMNTSNTIISPETPTEFKLVALFEKLLCVSPISITDNFFEIGGDSILALKLQIELLNQNIDITYADIFKYSTVKDLALKIDANATLQVSISDNDFDDNLNNLLEKNTIANITLNYKPLGDVVLVGSTGFLGSHILDNILKNTNANIYCLIRKDPGISILDKFLNKLHYYFGNQYDNLIDNRIFIIESDVTKEDLGLSSLKIEKLFGQISCVINSMAIVKHYGYYSEFERVNVLAVKNLVKYCEMYNRRFVQISTISVSGNTLMDLATNKNSFSNDIDFTENCLNISQSLENVYVRSKYEAEKFILKEICYHSLNAIILRVGNITNRFSDGLFQPNSQENAFMHRMKAIIEFKFIPDSLLNNYIEFSPVDYVADAIIRSIENVNIDINILHIYNQNHVFMKDLLLMLSDYDIKVVSNNIFKDIVKNTLHDSQKSASIAYILNDFDKDYNLIYHSNIKIKNAFSKCLLEKVGFNWPIIDKEYINKLLTNY
ncbi:MAG: amino acid adenylation domain-containing protein [Clostridia bacterium]|nr:amino acid adenylation domain-containing protein [Clostridia bacterium]